MIISTTPAIRHVIDRYLNHQTLSSNSAFRNFTRWQPRDMIGQIYVSPALMETYQKSAHDPSQMMPVSMREYLMRLNPAPQAITYALSNDGFGAIHELHLPKSFVIASIAGAASVSKEPPPEMNEQIAMSMLRSKLYEFEMEKKREATRKIEDSKLDIDFGSQIRSYVLQPYRLIKDHRTKTEVGDVDRVIDGDLQPFIRAYLRMRRDGGSAA